MGRAFAAVCGAILLIISAPRLPAPIHEIAESPTPTTTPEPTYDYRAFVLQHLQKCINRDNPGIVADYANTVDYYENGMVGLSFIAKDRQKFSTSWPTFSIQLTSAINYDASNAPRVTITFNYDFEAHNGEKISRGSTENIWTLLQTPSGLKITAEKQKVTNRSRK